MGKGACFHHGLYIFLKLLLESQSRVTKHKNNAGTLFPHCMFSASAPDSSCALHLLFARPNTHNFISLSLTSGFLAAYQLSSLLSSPQSMLRAEHCSPATALPAGNGKQGFLWHLVHTGEHGRHSPHCALLQFPVLL